MRFSPTFAAASRARLLYFGQQKTMRDKAHRAFAILLFFHNSCLVPLTRGQIRIAFVCSCACNHHKWQNPQGMTSWTAYVRLVFAAMFLPAFPMHN